MVSCSRVLLKAVVGSCLFHDAFATVFSPSPQQAQTRVGGATSPAATAFMEGQRDAGSGIIKVHMMSGEIDMIYVSYQEGDTIKGLKTKIAEKLQLIPPVLVDDVYLNHLKLMNGDQVLDDPNAPLSDVLPSNGDRLTVTLVKTAPPSKWYDDKLFEACREGWAKEAVEYLLAPNRANIKPTVDLFALVSKHHGQHDANHDQLNKIVQEIRNANNAKAHFFFRGR